MASVLHRSRRALALPNLGALAVRLFGATALSAAMLLAGCGDDPAPTQARCTGVSRDGKCIAKCEAARDCTAGQICSPLAKASDAVAEEGFCYSACTDDKSCALGEVCVAKTDMTGAEARLCRPRAVEGLPPNGFGVACTADAGCDTAHGLACASGRCGFPLGGACKAAGECSSNVCEGGACQKPCNQLSDCGVGSQCEGLEVGKKAGICGTKPTLAAGKYSQACPKGTECDKAAGFRCLGFEGDPDAYCTKLGDCAADTDCPTGYWCGGIRGEAEEDEVGIPASERTCVKRAFCAPCGTDADCGYTFGAKCVPDVNGAKFCSVSCTPDKRSCRFGAACVDVGGGDFACRPDAGSCVQEEPVSCGPCRNDLDCGPGGYCLGDSIQGAINKPSVRWCVTPCGPADASGKRTCPKGASGLEMICLDENNLDLNIAYLGVGPDAFLPGYCFPAVTFDPEQTTEIDPLKNVCGNGLRDPGEECDDSNKNAKDGCDACVITADCRFTTAEDNGDAAPGLVGANGPVTMVPPECATFLVEGAIAKPGAVAVIQASMAKNLSTSLAEVFTGGLDACDTDLVLEVRDGLAPDLTTSCKDLLPPDFSNILDCGKALACGDCKLANKCGLCDDDNGIGNCPRALVMRLSSYDGTKVNNASADKTLRIYARDGAATAPAFKLLFGALKSDSSPGSLAAPANYTCW